MCASTKFVCRDCVTDTYLKSQAFKDEKIHICSYCKDSNKALSLEDFSEIIHTALQEHFQLTPDQPSDYEYTMYKESNHDWERDGQPVNFLLQDIAGINEDITADVLKYLSDTCTDYELLKMGEEDAFGFEAHYDESPANQFSIEESWNTLCSDIKTRARFFSAEIENTLNELFKDLYMLESHGDGAVIKLISPSDEFNLYRARIAQSEKEIEKILKSPVEELGAPPSIYASSGRMNPAGIPVFYGAENQSTCINEVRPPVGSHIVIGKFEILHEIRLLDMNVLSKSFKKHVSVFDPDATEIWGRVAFLRRLVSELTRPIMPGDEEFEYLPTQVVAEYLSEKLKPRLDGIIFKSSQSADEGNNIVLFNHASHTKQYEVPDGTNTSIDFGWGDENGYDDRTAVSEVVPLKDDSKDQEAHSLLSVALSQLSGGNIDNDEEMNLSSDHVTLALDVDNIEIRRIQGVTYEVSNRSVSRYRSEETKDVPF